MPFITEGLITALSYEAILQRCRGAAANLKSQMQDWLLQGDHTAEIDQPSPDLVPLMKCLGRARQPSAQVIGWPCLDLQVGGGLGVEIGCILFFPPLNHSLYRRVSVSLQSSWSVLAPFPAALTPS